MSWGLEDKFPVECLYFQGGTVDLLEGTAHKVLPRPDVLVGLRLLQE